VRAGGRESTVFVLEDGSRIEVKPESELSFDRVDGGLRLRLNEGSILVSAANRESVKPLHVESGDTIVRVSAGEFLFEARPSRKRILVYGGEIEVQRGLTLHKVLPGQQVWDGPSSEEQSLAEAIAWSRSASRLAGLLPQPPASPSPVSVETQPAIAEIRAHGQPAQAEPQPQQVPSPVPQPEQPQQESDTAADERGRQILNRECGSCHAVDVVSSRHFGNREAYAGLVSRQIAFGASVTDEEFQVLVDYLFKTYGLK
jgi:cytochrome c5